MRYQVIYVSKTGNTEMIAEEIFEAIPNKEKDIAAFVPGKLDYDADIYFIGFCVERGTCSIDLLNYISEMHGTKVALFGTCGMGNSPEYYKRIEDEIEAWIPDDCEYLGAFLCQGKMPMSIRTRYESIYGQGKDEQIEYMIRNFDNALTHPDKTDRKNAKAFVESKVKSEGC